MGIHQYWNNSEENSCTCKYIMKISTRLNDMNNQEGKISFPGGGNITSYYLQWLSTDLEEKVNILR
jgi:hypothetical protein